MIKIFFKLQIFIFWVLLVACNNAGVQNETNNKENDFVAGCQNSGEFGKYFCECVFDDLNQNYKKDFSSDSDNINFGTEENKIFNKKISEAFVRCDDKIF